MNLDVSQQNLYLFLPSKICWMAEMLSDEQQIGIVEAVKKIYASATYKRLEKEETKLAKRCFN